MWREGRIAAEYVNLTRDPVYYGRGVPRGGGRPVLLIPGFLAGDSSLIVLSGWLRRMGYRPAISGISFNVHYSEQTLDGIVERLRRLVSMSGRKAAVIGHSRGGLLAKVVGDRHPDLVDRVVALGSPLADVYDVHPLTMAGVHAARFYNWVRFRLDWDAEQSFLADLAEPARVPVTSIYTRSDGVVNWKACLRDDVTALEVPGTHSGLAVNADVYRLLARLLAS
jgi:pimeloyl-ACP methyl ester carboxylesterase